MKEEERMKKLDDFSKSIFKETMEKIVASGAEATEAHAILSAFYFNSLDSLIISFRGKNLKELIDHLKKENEEHFNLAVVSAIKYRMYLSGRINND